MGSDNFIRWMMVSSANTPRLDIAVKILVSAMNFILVEL